MSNVAISIMDAAERRIRKGGFGGFSFRELAADVGVKSSSVHYHFPTKEHLAAAVIRRYTDVVMQMIDEQFEKDPQPIRAWIHVFRRTIFSDWQMCPATVMGAAALDLPPEVVIEVKRFFQTCLEKLMSQGCSALEADEFLSTLIGALVVANALGNPEVYDQATRKLLTSAQG